MGARSPDSRLTTTVDVLKALGGVKDVAGLLEIEYGVVENWKRSKTFPSRYYAAMTCALKEKRLRAPPSLWGQVTTPAMEEAAA